MSCSRSAEQPLGIERDGTRPGAESRLAARLLRQRREREALLGRELVAEPVWTIILMLLVAQGEGCTVPVSTLCLESQVPAETAERWVVTLTAKGMILVEDGEARLDPALCEKLCILLRSWIEPES